MKKHNLLKGVLSGVILCSLSACNSYYYVPTDGEVVKGQKLENVNERGDSFYTAPESNSKRVRLDDANYRQYNPEGPRPRPLSAVAPAPNRMAPDPYRNEPKHVRNSNLPPKPHEQRQPVYGNSIPAEEPAAPPRVVNNTTSRNTPPVIINDNNGRYAPAQPQTEQAYYYNDRAVAPTPPAPNQEPVRVRNNYNNDPYNQAAVEVATPIGMTPSGPAQNMPKKQVQTERYETYNSNQASPNVNNNQIIPGTQYTVFFKNGAKMIGTIEQSSNPSKLLIRTAAGTLYEGNRSDITKLEARR